MELVVCDGYVKGIVRILVIEAENTVSAPCGADNRIIENVVVKAEFLLGEGTAGRLVTDCYRIGLSVAVNHAVFHDNLLVILSGSAAARTESGIVLIVTENSAGGLGKIQSVNCYILKIFLEEIAAVICHSHVFENNGILIGGKILRIQEYRRRIRKNGVLYIRIGIAAGLCNICAAGTIRYGHTYVIVLKLNMQARIIAALAGELNTVYGEVKLDRCARLCFGVLKHICPSVLGCVVCRAASVGIKSCGTSNTACKYGFIGRIPGFVCSPAVLHAVKRPVVYRGIGVNTRVCTKDKTAESNLDLLRVCTRGKNKYRDIFDNIRICCDIRFICSIKRAEMTRRIISFLVGLASVIIAYFGIRHKVGFCPRTVDYISIGAHCVIIDILSVNL